MALFSISIMSILHNINEKMRELRFCWFLRVSLIWICRYLFIVVSYSACTVHHYCNVWSLTLFVCNRHFSWSVFSF